MNGKEHCFGAPPPKILPRGTPPTAHKTWESLSKRRVPDRFGASPDAFLGFKGKPKLTGSQHRFGLGETVFEAPKDGQRNSGRGEGEKHKLQNAHQTLPEKEKTQERAIQLAMLPRCMGMGRLGLWFGRRAAKRDEIQRLHASRFTYRLWDKSCLINKLASASLFLTQIPKLEGPNKSETPGHCANQPPAKDDLCRRGRQAAVLRGQQPRLQDLRWVAFLAKLLSIHLCRAI